MSVDVCYGQQHHRGLKLLIVQGGGPCLLGRDWLKVVRLNWRSVGKVSATASLQSHVATLQNRYQEVFLEKLGTITPFQAKLSVAPDKLKASWIGLSEMECWKRLPTASGLSLSSLSQIKARRTNQDL